MKQVQRYFEDQYLKELESSILKTDGSRVLIAENLFFPKTKSELNDLGAINGLKVTGVEKEENNIWLILDKNNLKENDKVSQKIDWERRYLLMKIHSALHFVAGIFEKEQGIRAVAGNVYEDKGVLTFKQTVPEMILYDIEDKVNEMTKKDVEIKTYWDEKREGFRWCKVGDLEPIPCGGLHVKNISEIGKINLSGTGDKVEIKLG